MFWHLKWHFAACTPFYRVGLAEQGGPGGEGTRALLLVSFHSIFAKKEEFCAPFDNCMSACLRTLQTFLQSWVFTYDPSLRHSDSNPTTSKVLLMIINNKFLRDQARPTTLLHEKCTHYWLSYLGIAIFASIERHTEIRSYNNYYYRALHRNRSRQYNT